MYDIRQFRPTVQVLLALGFTGFAIATLAPLLWVIAIAFLLLNGWLIKHDRFKPLPRWTANLLTVVAAVWTAAGIYADPGKPIFPIGNFLVALQIIKMFELRGNRDYAQLLVLSVLLMVAAVISTASLIFGLTFIAYVLICPYASLLFHLKVETDYAKRQMGLDEKLADPLTLRQDQRFLHRSMTRLTVLVGAVAFTTAVIVFIFFPRVPGSGFLAWQFRPAQAATGMSDQMNMQSVTRVQQNNTEIGSVTVTHNGTPVTGGELYFRGTVYDTYHGDPSSPARWSWERASQRGGAPFQLREGTDKVLPRSFIEKPDADVWVQDFSPLKPTGASFLLAIGGAYKINVGSPTQVGYSPRASVIQLGHSMDRAMFYRVISSGTVAYMAWPYRDGAPPEASPAGGNPGPRPPDSSQYVPVFPQSVIDPRIRDYALKPEVSGADPSGKPLVAKLPETPQVENPSPLTGEIARNIERHLQTQFTYTLDLADDRPKDDTDDPVVHFLYESKTGWCEHYAYAMTLMCQSLGMNARLVSGYKCDEYNNVGGWFVLRQSQAHAWVEVLERENGRLIWKTYDPTSGIRNTNQTRVVSNWTRVLHVFDYLEHAWANSVVAFDANSQTTLFESAESKLVNAGISANSAVRGGGNAFSNFSDWLSSAKYTLSEGAIVILVTLMALTAIGVTVGYLAQRLRLTRRARRIGLDSLDGAEARRLARQLGFYDELTRILERRSIERPAHLTPLEFGQSLSFLPYEAYETIVRLTGVFYRVRFGNAQLSAGQRRSLARVVERLQQQLLATKR